MSISLEPSSQLVLAVATATGVYAIFSNGTPNYADVRHAEPGSTNTYKCVNNSTLTAVALTTVVALLSRSPTVFVIAGGLTLVEAWKYHAANFGAHGAQENPTLAN